MRDAILIGAAACSVALAATLYGPPARAQAEDQATARALFDEARGLMKAAHYDQACPKLEAASKLYPGSGVLLNLGDCYEHTGRTASAWTEFAEAASAAARTGRPRDQAEAERRKAAIESKLSRIAITVKSPAAGLVIKRNGTPLDAAVWGEAVPVDPGKHLVTAEAPGRRPWSGEADVEGLGKTVTVEVPALEPETEPAPAPASEPALAPSGTASSAPTTSPAVPPSSPALSPSPGASTAATPAQSPSYWSTRRVLGASLAGAGLVGAGVGVVLGVVAKAHFDTASSESGAQRASDSSSAASLGNAGTWVGVAGAVVGAAGLLLWLTAPSAEMQVGAHVGATGSAVVLRGGF